MLESSSLGSTAEYNYNIIFNAIFASTSIICNAIFVIIGAPGLKTSREFYSIVVPSL